MAINPLSEWDPPESLKPLQSNDKRFLEAVRTIALLAEPVRTGIITIVEPNPVDWQDGLMDLTAKIGAAGYRAAYEKHIIPAIDQGDVFARMQDVLEAMLYISAQSLGRVDDSFLAVRDFRSEVIHELLGAVAEPGEIELPASDSLRLEQILRLSLPGVDQLQTDAIVDIRADDSFLIFRQHMQEAISYSEDSLGAGDRQHAVREVSEYMTARAKELSNHTRRSSFFVRIQLALIEGRSLFESRPL